MTTIDLKKQERNIDIEIQRKLKDEMVQKRYFVAELVKKALDKHLADEGLVVDNTNSIYNLPLINEELNIIDFEINSLSVHVVATFDKGKNSNVYIQSLYRQCHFKPDMFLFVNFSKTFAKMEIIGYITEPDYRELVIPKAVLASPDNLIETLKSLKPRQNKVSSSTLDAMKELMLAYFEKDLSEEGKRFFLKNIIYNKDVRKNYKTFYALNCDFICIAKTSSIEKYNPDDQRIDLHSRSDYLMDKAIYKYREEHGELMQLASQIADEEFQVNTNSYDEETQEQEEEITFIDNDALNNNVLQISLESQNPKEEEPVEEMQEETINLVMPDTSQHQEQQQEKNTEEPEATEYGMAEQVEDSPEVELVQTEQPVENTVEEITSINEEPVEEQELEQEFSLDDTDDVMDLSESEPDIEYSLNDNADESEFRNVREEMAMAEENEPVSAEIELNESVEEDMLPAAEELLQEDTELPMPEEDALMDISNNDDLEEMLADDEPQEEELTAEALLAEDPSEETEEINATEGGDEDLFAFLSEIADEETQSQPESVNQMPTQEIPEEYNNPQPPQQEFSQEEVAFEQAQQMGMPQQDMPQQNIPQMQQDQTYIEPTQMVAPPKKSNTSKILAVFVCVCALGAFQYKDTLLSFISGNSANEDAQIDNIATVPGPIDSTKLDNNAATPDAQAGQPAPDAPVPAAPTPTAPGANSENVPPVDQAPTLPNLPTKTVETGKPKHLNDAIATALTKDFNGVRISKLSWEMSETLLGNAEVKRYLTIAGKSIKNSLTQDLLSATEPSINDSIVVTITYKKDGSTSNAVVTSSSGSQQVDNIVLKSVKDTLNYVKMPALNLSVPEYTAKVVIRL